MKKRQAKKILKRYGQEWVKLRRKLYPRDWVPQPTPKDLREAGLFTVSRITWQRAMRVWFKYCWGRWREQHHSLSIRFKKQAKG